MKLGYRLSRVCGNVFENGNLTFTADGNSIISPVGNRVTVMDLISHTSSVLPFENSKNIKRVAISHNGRFLVSVDVDGAAIFFNIQKKVILQRFHFKTKVFDIKFSPDDAYFSVTVGRSCQIWRTPSASVEFAPLILARTISGHHGDVECLDWSDDSESIIMGSRDLSARIYYRVHSKNMASTVLSGHRDVLKGVFFSKDAEEAYTVAADCAVFTWKFEYGDRPQYVLDNPEGDGESGEQTTVSTRGSTWKLSTREFLWEPHVSVSSTAFNKKSKLLVIGFSHGVFGVYEMPGCVNLHKLSVSNFSLNAASINCTGEWLALGSSRLGQLLVWEWQSETYVLKQQGHLYGMNSLDFSSDGNYVATGGEDGKVKLWNMSTGFCFTTFSEHTAPVTGVKFIGKGAGKAILSCSLDGTVRAHDMMRYRNFRTLTSPTPVQFSCVSVDSSGEVVCAGALDPFQVYLWSLHTGHILDVLSGHEGPIACVKFADNTGTLATGSWDGTLKLWNIYSNTCSETLEHGCDVLAVCFRPDGKVCCTATTNGNLTFWEVESGAQLSSIEGRRDISGGRHSTDRVTAENSSRSKHFTTVSFSADGTCVIAGGKSKFVCIYNVSSGALVKKFQLSHNRSLEGVLDNLRSDQMVDGVAVQNLRSRGQKRSHGMTGADSDDEHFASASLPGTGGGDGSRTTRPDIRTNAIGFSATGREWAAATTQGLQIFSLDESVLFAPTRLDTAITPAEVDKALASHSFAHAINMALLLGTKAVLKRAVDAVEPASIELIQKSIDISSLDVLMRFLAEEITESRHVEFYLKWCLSILKTHSTSLMSGASSGAGLRNQESLRSLIRAVSKHEKEIMTACDLNQYNLCFLAQQVANVSKGTASDIDSSREGDLEDLDTPQEEHAVRKTGITSIRKTKSSK